jgi:hypothetical protein
LTASSNAACTCSGGLDVLHVDVAIRHAGLEAVELDLDRLHKGGDGVALLVQHRIDLAATDDSRTATSAA